MPPSLSVGPWMLVYYANLATVDRPAERFWLEFGKDLFDAYKQQLRLTSPIRTNAAEATKTAATTPDKGGAANYPPEAPKALPADNK
jgi:hypothetical protein